MFPYPPTPSPPLPYPLPSPLQDLEMYHESSDTPALVRNSNLNEELGQVSAVAKHHQTTGPTYLTSVVK